MRALMSGRSSAPKDGGSGQRSNNASQMGGLLLGATVGSDYDSDEGSDT